MMHSSTCVANQPRSMFSRPSDGMQVSRYSISCFKRSLTSAVCRTSGVLLRELSSTRSFDVRRLLLTYVSQRTCWGLTNRWVGACWSILPLIFFHKSTHQPKSSVETMWDYQISKPRRWSVVAIPTQSILLNLSHASIALSHLFT